jgi:hypothetical protein
MDLNGVYRSRGEEVFVELLRNSASATGVSDR